ncbi:hypothetical protein MKW92_029308 [Papaver armeniacum]|nr:hypothetical protein MKW92_029308 [Papaver armeniacum]
MKRSVLENSSYLKDDCLHITCKVSVLKTRDEAEGKHLIIPVPPSDMNQNFKGLLKSEIGCDITFRVGNEFFRAHKLILAARSPVFRAQFFGSFGNPEIEKVTIQEFEPFAFKAMLLFLYSDELPEPRELSVSNSRCTSTTIMHHLLAAADRYDLGRLKLMCEAKLCEEITASTVATTLALAERYQCLQLKTGCLQFAAKPENLEEFMKSDGFSHLEKSCPSLLVDLLKTSVASKTNHKILSSESVCETVNGSHEYRIKGYSLAKGIGVGKCMRSRTFTVGGHDWVILFYPDGLSEDDEEYVSVFLELANTTNKGDVRALFDLKLIDHSGEEDYGDTSISPNMFNNTVEISRGYPQYIKRSDLESSNYLKDDCLSIYCTVGIVQTRDETVENRVTTLQTRIKEGKHNVFHVPPSDMVQNLKGLLESGIGSDITFHVGNETFRAHKLILAARSPVFRAQFLDQWEIQTWKQ